MDFDSRKLTVRGSGKASVPPDWIVINIDLVASEYNYADTIKAATRQLAQLRESLYSVGFKKEDIKTKRLNVDTVYSRYKDKSDNYQRVFQGYKANHDLYIAFDIDNDRLGRIIKAISESEAEPEFSIEYTVKNKNKVKYQLLKNAVADARKKAEVLTEAAGVSLGLVLRIDYDWTEVRFHHNYGINESMSMLKEDSMDIMPDDIDAADNVTIVWSLE